MAILVRGGNSSRVLHCSHCSPTYIAILVRGGEFPRKCSRFSSLQPVFSQGVFFSKFLPMQPIAAHSYVAFSGRGDNSPKFIPLQPIAAHSYMVILVRRMGNSSDSPVADQWSPTYIAVLVRGEWGGISQKSS